MLFQRPSIMLYMIQFRVVDPICPIYPFPPNLVDRIWVFLHTCPEVQIEYTISVVLHYTTHISDQLHDLDPSTPILTSKWVLI